MANIYIQMKEVYNKVLDEVAIDPRLTTGIFDIRNNDHLAIFREYLIKEGISEEAAIELSNRLAEAGRFPERQAYNKDGLLVTFPSPEHKQRAISRGTHYEKNPKDAQINIFGGEVQPAAATPAAAPQAPAPQAPAPQGQAPVAQAPTAPAAPTPAPTVPATPNAPTAKAEPVNISQRTPEERAQDAAAVEKMLKTEYTLAEAAMYGFYMKGKQWFDSNGNYVGKNVYLVDKQKQVIRP